MKETDVRKIIEETGVGFYDSTEPVVRPKGWALGLHDKIDWQLPDDHPYAMAEMHYAYDEEMHPTIEEGLREAIIEHESKRT